MNRNPEVNAYIAAFEAPLVRQRLEEMRALLRRLAPMTEEVISYQMPAYRGNRVLVYFAGYKGHVGFYPTGAGIKAFQQELEAGPYKWSAGAIQFPLDAPLPEAFIRRIVEVRMKQDAGVARAKAKPKA